MSESATTQVQSTFTVCVVHQGSHFGERERTVLALMEAIRAQADGTSGAAISFEVVARPESAFLAAGREAGFVSHEIELPPLTRLGQARDAARRLAQAIGEARLVHAIGVTAAAHSGRAARGTKASVIWQLGERALSWPVVRWVRRRTHCWMAPTSDAFTRRGIAARHPFARVVPHALRPDRILLAERRAWSSQEHPVVGMLGRFDLKENHHIFLEMARIVSTRRPAARYVIAAAMGPGQPANRTYADSLGHLVKAYGLEDKISFRARPRDLNEFFDSIDLFVEPSTRPGSDYLALLAMARRLPVIGTLTQGFPELITSGDTGWLTLPRDSRGLAQACQFLLGNPEISIAMGERAMKSVVSIHELDVVRDRLESVYRELLGGGAGAARPVSLDGAVAP